MCLFLWNSCTERVGGTSMTTAQRSSLCSLFLLLTLPTVASAADVDRPLAAATTQYELGHWQQAAALFEQVLTTDQQSQSNLSVQYYLAECRLQLGQYTAAQSIFGELAIAKDFELATDALFRSGEAAYFAGNDAVAEEQLSKFLSEQPQHASAAHAYYFLGEVTQRQGDLSSAIGALRTVVEQYPESDRATPARLALARALLTSGDFEQVPALLTGLKPGNDSELAAEVRLLEGRVKFAAANYAAALYLFQRTYQEFPETTASHRARIAAAWALWRLEQFDAIETEIEPLADETTWKGDYHYLRGMAAYGLKDWSTGARQLSKAAALRPDHPSHDAILFYQGLCYLRDGRQAAAKSLLERLSVEHPQSEWHDDALWELARLARSEKNQIEYHSTVKKLREEQPTSDYITSFYDESPAEAVPDNLEAAQQLLDEAVGLERDGHHHSAVAAYRKLLEFQPANMLTRQGLWRSARLHQRMKQRCQAAQLYERLLSEDPQSPHAAEAHFSLGTMQLTTKNGAAAREQFTNLLEKFPQSAQAAEAAYWLARLAADEKDSETATRYLDTALQSIKQASAWDSRRDRLLAQAAALRCQVATMQQDWQQVEVSAEQALAVVPVSAERFALEYWKAEAAFRSGNYDKARKEFAALAPRTFGIHEQWVAMVPLRRAQLAARRQQWREVIKLLDQLERQHTNFSLQYEVDYLRGRAMAGRGQMTAARDYYQEVLKNRSARGTETAVAAQWMIGETYFHQQIYGTARLAFEAVMKLDAPADWQARAALQAGKCWELEQNWQQASAVYSAALERWPESEPQAQIAARLKWAKSRTNVRR